MPFSYIHLQTKEWKIAILFKSLFVPFPPSSLHMSSCSCVSNIINLTTQCLQFMFVIPKPSRGRWSHHTYGWGRQIMNQIRLLHSIDQIPSAELQPFICYFCSYQEARFVCFFFFSLDSFTLSDTNIYKFQKICFLVQIFKCF